MVEAKVTGLEGAGQNFAKLIERLGIVGDQKMGRTAAAGVKPLLRPSTWINTVGAVLGIALPVGLKMPATSPWGEIGKAAGWHFMTKWWDYGEEYVTGVVPPAAVPTGRVVTTPPPKAGIAQGLKASVEVG